MKKELKNKYDLLKNNFDKIIKPQLSGKTESLKVAVINNNNFKIYSYGKAYKYYDLASLTKPIFTMSAFLYFEEFESKVINKKVKDILPWFKVNNNIKVSDLLAHQSGAPALYPVYKNLKYQTVNGLDPLNQLLREVNFNAAKPLYSDVGYFILGAILEVIYNKPLWHIFEDLRSVFEYNQMHFNIIGEPLKFSKKLYAPTEVCKLRHKKIMGEVHDESCWRMGGVGPHAGLFGSIEDVVKWTLSLMQTFDGKTHFSSSVLDSFYKKQKGDWRLGMMLPSRPISSCGIYFSDKSYGHLGFTGTSFWVDPKVNLGVVILSNRTYPDRDNKEFNILRPLIHNMIWETFNG